MASRPVHFAFDPILGVREGEDFAQKKGGWLDSFHFSFMPYPEVIFCRRSLTSVSYVVTTTPSIRFFTSALS